MTALSQYVGFFGLLWMTWYNVSLYDVRFATDSVFERIFKALQFGAMIGFAVSGPQFDVGEDTATITGNSDNVQLNVIPDPNFSSFRALTLMMMLSRIVLVFQYLQALWFTRKYRQARLPLAVVAATHALAAVIFLSLIHI